MTRFLKSSFLRQFAGGFLIGALGMTALHVTAQPAAVAPYAATRVAH